MPEISHESVRKRVLDITLDEMRGFNDWSEYSYRLTDSISILISSYTFSKPLFFKKTGKIRTTFFRDNNLKRIDFLGKLFKRVEILNETLLMQEILMVRIKNPRQIPKKVKLIVFKRDKGKCRSCKTKGKGGLMWKINYDHDLAFAKDGSSLTPKNVKLLCFRCNLKKSDKIE